MTRIVAERTPPYPRRISRQHAPCAPIRGNLTYDKFKDCLRWEFGFTCAVCLLHEVHFVLPGTGSAGTGVMTVEHIVLKSTPQGKPLEHDYGNCLLLCRLCNGNRGDRHAHVKPDGTRLLNPTSDVWADHFDVRGARLEPKPGNLDAKYTHDAYGINDEMHTLRRRKLSDLVRMLIDNLHRDRAEIARLDQDILQSQSVTSASGWQLTQRGKLVDQMRRTLTALQDLSGVPSDAPQKCRCKTPLTQVTAVIVEGWQQLPQVPVAAPPLPSGRRFRA